MIASLSTMQIDPVPPFSGTDTWLSVNATPKKIKRDCVDCQAYCATHSRLTLYTQPIHTSALGYSYNYIQFYHLFILF